MSHSDNSATDSDDSESLSDSVIPDRYRLYMRMKPPPRPSAPIHPFFAGIPAPTSQISHYSDYEFSPVIYMENSWSESIVLTAESDSRRRPRAALSPETVKDSHFFLNNPLRRGRDRWSQTWLGCMQLPSKEMVTVVIKLFQESYFPECEPLPLDESGENRSFSRGARSASAEAHAYTRLADLQGADIPWSYGFYKFRIMDETPETAYAHVMEYIPMPSAEDALRAYSVMRQKPDIAPLKIMDALVEGVGKLHTRGICHRDLNAANHIIVQNGDAVDVIFIDFGASSPFHTWCVFVDGRALIGCMSRYGIDTPEIKKRWEERRGSYYDLLFENVYFADSEA